MSVRPGTRLDGRYRLAERLAYGGMGEVWRATDEVLSREVAVKILRPELAEDEAFVRRFRAEARTTSGLPHNGIAAVYDYGETRVGADGQSPAPMDDDEADPVAYLVMELVPGEALSSTLSREGALSPDKTLDLVAQAGRALHAAHQRGVIHRDIKPANLMVTPDGRVKVTDFGIARPLDHEPLTATGQVMGTAHYLAPELAKGQDASALSDVYALGVVAYECLAGHRPFEGDNQVAVALAHLNEMPPPLPASVPEPVRAVVGAAMEKDPQRRMPTAEAFAAALETLRYQANGDEHLTPGTGILPGSAAETGLAVSGLLPGNRSWTPGLPGGREGVGAAASTGNPQGFPPSGTHLLGPAVGPRTGGMPGGYGGGYGPGSGGAPGRPDGGYGGYGGGPSDPFRTATAPGGMSITPSGRPRGRQSSAAGPVLLLAGLAVAAVIIVMGLWLTGFFDTGENANVPGGGSGTEVSSTPSEVPSQVAPGVTSSSRTTQPSTRTGTRKPSTTSSTSKSPTPTTSTSDSPSPSDTQGEPPPPPPDPPTTSTQQTTSSTTTTAAGNQPTPPSTTTTSNPPPTTPSPASPTATP